MGETRIAILEEDRLVEVYVEKQGQQRMVSNIYKGNIAAEHYLFRKKKFSDLKKPFS